MKKVGVVHIEEMIRESRLRYLVYICKRRPTNTLVRACEFIVTNETRIRKG